MWKRKEKEVERDGREVDRRGRVGNLPFIVELNRKGPKFAKETLRR